MVTLATWDKNSGVKFNDEYWGNPEKQLKLQNLLDDLERKTVIPKDCNSPEFIIWHEIGHQVWYTLITNHPEITNEIMDIILAALKSGELHAWAKHSTQENIKEAFCDVFAAMWTQPPELQPWFVKEVKKLYKNI